MNPGAVLTLSAVCVAAVVGALALAFSRALAPAYDVETASSVDGALDAVAKGPPDAIVCDLMMPDGGGERLLSVLEERRSPLRTRIVLVTGGASFLKAELALAIERVLDA